ncbi:MAG: hypothetical protein K2N38_02740 [Oscillospiraceae bacterium]|nr:hypothetical protein [Oscillospiraceae bacterium]
MKKALTIILTLILGFGANFLAVLGLYCLVFFVTDSAAICFSAAIAVIAALIALLHFVRNKLTKFAHGAVIILCAQLPFILFWAVNLLQFIYYYKTTDFRSGFERIGAGIDVMVSAIAVIIPAVIMAAAFIAWAVSANKNKIKKWWNEIFKNGKENTI